MSSEDITSSRHFLQHSRGQQFWSENFAKKATQESNGGSITCHQRICKDQLVAGVIQGVDLECRVMSSERTLLSTESASQGASSAGFAARVMVIDQGVDHSRRGLHSCSQACKATQSMAEQHQTWSQRARGTGRRSCSVGVCLRRRCGYP